MLLGRREPAQFRLIIGTPDKLSREINLVQGQASFYTFFSSSELVGIGFSNWLGIRPGCLSPDSLRSCKWLFFPFG